MKSAYTILRYRRGNVVIHHDTSHRVKQIYSKAIANVQLNVHKDRMKSILNANCSVGIDSSPQLLAISAFILFSQLSPRKAGRRMLEDEKGRSKLAIT